MALNGRDYSDNDIDLPSTSTLSVTLCIRGRPSEDSLEIWGPSSPSRYTLTPCPPIRTIQPVQPTAAKLDDSSKPLDDETPTFEFGKHSVNGPLPQQSSPVEVEVKSEAEAACDVQHATVSVYSHQDSRKREYSAATMADFQKHLGVIDCRPITSASPENTPAPNRPFDHGLHSVGTGNSALQDYQLQLMLLEQAKNRRLMMQTSETNNKADSLSPYSPPASAYTAWSMNPNPQALSGEQHMGRTVPQPHACHLAAVSPGDNERFQARHQTRPMQDSKRQRNISNHLADADYQMQLILLEQQNKRLLKKQARQEMTKAQPGYERH